MLIILCDTYRDAMNAFDIFMSFLEDTNPWSIERVWEHGLGVQTENNYKYFFTDYKMKEYFERMDSDFIDSDRFFEGIDELYDAI